MAAVLSLINWRARKKGGPKVYPVLSYASGGIDLREDNAVVVAMEGHFGMKY